MAIRSNEGGRDVAETGTQHYTGTGVDPNGRTALQDRPRAEQSQAGGAWGQQGPGLAQRIGRFYQSAMERLDRKREEFSARRGRHSEQTGRFGSEHPYGQGQTPYERREGMEPSRRDYGREREEEHRWGRGELEREGRGMGGRPYSEGERHSWPRHEGQGYLGRESQEVPYRRWSGSEGFGGYDLGFESRRHGFWQKESLTARDVMTRSIRTVTRQSSLRDVAQIMKDENVGIVPVVDEHQRLIGVLTDRDLVIRAFINERGPGQVRVEDVMTEEVECVTPEEYLVDTIYLMGSKQIRRVMVVDREDRLIGVISMGDIANRADYDEELQRTFEKVSSKRSFWSKLFG